MENAARAVVDATRDYFGTHEIAILCGGGNNGGDGLAVARHLHNLDQNVSIVFGSDPANLSGDALIQWRIVQAMKLPAFYTPHDLTGNFILKESGLIIDALFGTGLKEAPRESVLPLIDACNFTGSPFQSPVISIDVPSGMDCDTGLPLGTCVRATRTVTFVAEKVGFANSASRQFTGEITVGDIGCPRELIDAVIRDSGFPPVS
jgi:NAD(P)H-hydrate epimerase